MASAVLPIHLLAGVFVHVYADGDSIIRIDGAVAAFDVPDDPIFVDDDVRTKSPLIALTLDWVSF